MRDGDELYRLVEEYAALGEHRAGTPPDADTIEWLARLLAQSATSVERQPFQFDRYDASWAVRFDGEPVQAIPLFYEGVGKVTTTQPATMVWEPGLSNTGFDATLADFTSSALAAGATAAVIATGGPTGLLHAVNRQPELGSGLPSLLVPGRLSGRLESAEIAVELDAQLVPGASANVVAHYGDDPIEETLVITTPISGWFQCAGERGTGIAVAVEAAERLAADYPVLFIGASGHELYHQGAQLAVRELSGTPRAIVHIGASVAAAAEPPVAGKATLTPNINARVAAGEQQLARVAEAFATVGIETIAPERPTEPDEWVGESMNWARFGRPMISLVGGFPLFHAPEDTPERATTPTLLASVADAVDEAIRQLVS